MPLTIQTRLTLAELEACTCARLTRFLSLDFAGVTCQEALSLESRAVSLSIQIAESAGYSESDRFGLAFGAATDNVNLHVKLTFCLRNGERLVHDVTESVSLEVLLNTAAVDCDIALSSCEINTSYG